MNLNEKTLYHQIHPVKLFTDFSTAFISTCLMWKQLMTYAILFAFIPSIIVSIFIIKTTNLEKYKDSHFGSYLKENMDSRIVDLFRFIGFFLMMLGGWYRLIWIIIVGFSIIVICWSRGLLFGKIKNAT